MANAQQLSPQVRAQLFAQSTRQNWQVQPSKAGTENDSIQFDVPKVRLTSRVRLQVEAVVTVTHASQTSYVADAFAPFTLLRKVSVDMNNGFSPFSVSGRQLYMYSWMRDNASILSPAASGRGKVVQGLAASAGGTDNTIRFLADLPNQLNDRDPVGLILTQNQETTMTVTVDVDKADKVGSGQAGFTFALKSFKITPVVESFTIPALKDGMPDLSVLKLVQANTYTIDSAGQKDVALPVGQTYRKLAFFVEDGNGAGVADAAITGNVELLINQADIPYRLPASVLAGINHEQFGAPLPKGMFAFDWSYQGISNYGGARDYFDTERVTEFWLRLNPSAAGKITVVYETLSRLRG